MFPEWITADVVCSRNLQAVRLTDAALELITVTVLDLYDKESP